MVYNFCDKKKKKKKTRICLYVGVLGWAHTQALSALLGLVYFVFFSLFVPPTFIPSTRLRIFVSFLLCQFLFIVFIELKYYTISLFTFFPLNSNQNGFY